MFNKLKKLYNDTLAESNVLVAIVTVVVATILIIIAAIKPKAQPTAWIRQHGCFLNQLHRT